MSQEDSRVVAYRPVVRRDGNTTCGYTAHMTNKPDNRDSDWRGEESRQWVRLKDHESLLAEAEREVARRESHGLAQDRIILMLQDQLSALQSRLDAVVREVTDTVRRLENRAGRQKAGGLPANSTAIQGFANELKVALRSAALGGESPANDEVGT